MMLETMEEEHEALLQFLYMAPVGLVQMRPDGDVIMMNPLSVQLLMPITRDGSLSNFYAAMEGIAPELRNLGLAFTQDSGTICERLRVQVNAGIPGKTDPTILAVSLIKLDSSRLMAVIFDISIEAKRERQLKQSEAWFNAVFSSVTDYAVMGLDRNGTIETWNASVRNLTGFGAEAITGQPYSVLYPADAFCELRTSDLLKDADDNGWMFSEGWCRRADGSQFWASSLIVPVEPMHQRTLPLEARIAATAGYALIIRDASGKQNARENLLKASTTDHLTGVANRKAFFDAAEIELRRDKRSPRPISLIVLDADHFKRINDTYGHPAGDTVLRHLAQTMKTQLREMDVVARIGGEEFAILLPSSNLETAKAVAERIRTEIGASTVSVDGRDIHYTVSLGICTVDGDVKELDDMLKQADQALYAAKRNGRDRVEIAAGSTSASTGAC